jgi:hypothetical protein
MIHNLQYFPPKLAWIIYRDYLQGQGYQYQLTSVDKYMQVSAMKIMKSSFLSKHGAR